MLPSRPLTPDNIHGLDKQTSCKIRAQRIINFQKRRNRLVKYGKAQELPRASNKYKALNDKKRTKRKDKLKNANKYKTSDTLTCMFNQPSFADENKGVACNRLHKQNRSMYVQMNVWNRFVLT